MKSSLKLNSLFQACSLTDFVFGDSVQYYVPPLLRQDILALDVVVNMLFSCISALFAGCGEELTLIVTL
jgi:hypothetical protein